jgi:hypothetical protein
MPYPTAFPSQAFTNVANYIEGTSTESLPDALQNAYDVLGYGLSTFMPPTGAHAPSLSPVPLQTMVLTTPRPARKELVAEMRACVATYVKTAKNTPAGVANAGFTMPSWLIPLVMQVITDILGGVVQPKPTP